MKKCLTYFIFFITISTNSFGQINFTPEELLLLAEHNTERLYLKDLSDLQKQEIDSLYTKIELLQESFDLCDANQHTLNEMILKLNKVEEKRIEQNSILQTKTEKQAKIIKKQKRKLNGWRIATPIIIVAAFVGALFIN